MTDEERREILRAVAAGTMPPEEAARRFAVEDERTRLLDPPPDPGEWGAAAPTATGARRVRVRASAGVVRIAGDPEVVEAVVDGPHTVERDGDELLIDCQSLLRAFRDEPIGAYAAVATRPRRRLRLGLVGDHHPVRIRMNPALALDVELVAGSLTVDRVEGPITAAVNAGSATLRGVRGPVDCSVNAGSLTISGRLDHGDSRLACDMGAATIRLAPDSDLRVHASTTMGRIDVRLPRAADGDGWVCGDGTGSLAVHCTMSSVSITCE